MQNIKYKAKNTPTVRIDLCSVVQSNCFYQYRIYPTADAGITRYWLKNISWLKIKDRLQSYCALSMTAS